MTSSGMGGSEDLRPDTIPPVSGRTPRPTHAITDARKLRDEILAMIVERPRTETELIETTGRRRGEMKAALRRLSVADLAFCRETGSATRDAPLWHHWPTVIANLKARDAGRPVSVRERHTGMRVA